MPFFERVKPLWEKSDLTLAQLAELCNISESSASRYLNGKSMPPADVADQILLVLGGEAKTSNVQMTVKPECAQLVHEIREIYQSEITTLQANYARQISDLKQDKRCLTIGIVLLLGLMVFLIIDALHGNWGFIRYSMMVG